MDAFSENLLSQASESIEDQGSLASINSVSEPLEEDSRANDDCSQSQQCVC
jgi:hypothetical protein